MQVHVLQYLKYNIEKKTYTNHRAIFLETCLGSFQVFSYHPNGKLQPATIFDIWIIFLARLLQLGNSGTIAPPKTTNEKKNKKKRKKSVEEEFRPS